MKKILFVFTALLMATASQAQDTYSNYTMTNTTDVIGSARYMGMGGAMGALGADISAMSNNPASLGLFRRNDISISMGGVFQDESPYKTDSYGHYSFDQVGFVSAFPNYDRTSFFNFGVNFQKKADFGHSLVAGNSMLNGLSQAAQLKGLYEYGMTFPTNNNFQYSLPYQANNAYLYDVDVNGTTQRIKSSGYEFNRYTSGNLYGLDFGIAGSIQDRVYLGLDLGVDFLDYESNQHYIEYRDGASGEVEDYDILSNKRVSGSGLNFKLGALFRPIEESPLRIGVAIETPTWYVLSQEDSYYSIASKWNYDGYDETRDTYMYSYKDNAGDYAIYDSPDDNYLEFKLHSPWKFRLSVASTVDTYLAWDVEYEYALYNKATMGYSRADDYDGSSLSMTKDPGMETLTERCINGVHNLRAGVEFKPIPEFAVRFGYNFWSKPMKDNARFDQTVDSKAVDFLLGTDYMNLGATNMFSFGVGYRSGNFYADFAYKYRAQSGDFYAFDDSFQQSGDPSYQQFAANASQSLEPEHVSLDRHAITFTLGFKF
ncbi:MAG: hypothetical protein K6C30_00815 [Bacteroidaceae bacterium]|nr:hypothetical protein [Bacteroidaceae bacterium]